MLQLLRVVAASILAIPALLVSVVTSIIVWVLFLPSMALLTFRKTPPLHCHTNVIATETQQQEQRRHAIITGGSSGIGLAIAKECVNRGMDRVTILARHEGKLSQCHEELEALASSCNRTIKIQAISVDVTDSMRSNPSLLKS